MGLNATLFMMLVSLLARTGASFGTPGEVVSEAETSALEVTGICAATAEEAPPVCIAAAGVAGAYLLVEFAAAVWNYHEQDSMIEKHNKECELFKSDFKRLTHEFNMMAESVRQWRAFIDKKAWGNLSLSVNEVLSFGKSFVEMTKSAMGDVDEMSSASKNSIFFPAAAMVMANVFGLAQGQEHIPAHRVFPAGAAAVAVVALQGCVREECPINTIKLHDKLGDMKMNMNNAIICIEKLQGCVTPEGKPICSTKLMIKQDREIQGWLHTVKEDIQSIAQMKGLHLKTKNDVHQQQLLSTINHTWKPEFELVVNTMPHIAHIRDQTPTPVNESAKFVAFQTHLHRLMKRENSRNEAASKEILWCDGIHRYFTWYSMSIFLAVLGLIEFLALKKVGLLAPPLQQPRQQPFPTQGNEDSYHLVSGEQNANFRPIVTIVLLGLQLCMVVSLIVFMEHENQSCMAWELKSHDMKKWSWSAQNMIANVRSQQQCHKLGSLCSERQHMVLQMQFLDMVENLFEEFLV